MGLHQHSLQNASRNPKNPVWSRDADPPSQLAAEHFGEPNTGHAGNYKKHDFRQIVTDST